MHKGEHRLTHKKKQTVIVYRKCYTNVYFV